MLAAGAGSRFSPGPDASHKLLAPWRGHPVVWWSVSAALDAGFERTWVITGAADVSGALPAGAIAVPNPGWAQGQATSVQIAIDAARAEGFDALVVGLGDQPTIRAEAWVAVASADAPIAVATYHGLRRNPVKLSSSVWDLLPRTGDQGARVLITERPDLVVGVPCDGDPADIDTREDLVTWS